MASLMKVLLPVRIPAWSALLPLLMGAGELDLKQCAAVDDAGARLACYDALAGRSAPGGAATVPVLTTPAAAPSMDAFGKPAAPTGPEVMTARIDGKFTEWGSGTLVKLDNGQVWRVVEDRSAVYPNLPENAEVEISRGWFGYRMEIKAIGRRISVKRVS